MKLLYKILLILLLPAIAAAIEVEYYDTSNHKNSFEICQTGRQKALKQRGIKVTRDKDDLVRRTVRAYGGDYVRKGNMVTLTLNGKTYRDFVLELVDGKHLVIITPNDTIWLQVVDK